MYLPNTPSQSGYHPSFRADGTITTGGTPQLILPRAYSRCMLMIMNISTTALYMDHGPPRAKATISNGTVTGATVLNAGFGYTLPPLVQFQGGFGPFVANSSWDGRGLLGSASPTGLANQGDTVNPAYNRPAQAHCTLSGQAVNAIVIDDPGFGYVNPPEIVLYNQINDPFGCAVPSTTSGIILTASGGFYYLNHTAMWTDPVAIYGATTGQGFTVEYMP